MEAEAKNDTNDAHEINATPRDHAAFHRLTTANDRQCGNAFNLLTRLQREAAELGPALREGETSQATLAVALHGALVEIETGLRTLHDRKRYAELRLLGIDADKLDAWLASEPRGERPDVFLAPAPQLADDAAGDHDHSAPLAVATNPGTRIEGGPFDAALLQLRRSACAEGIACLVVFGAAAPGQVDAVVHACSHCSAETQELFGQGFAAVQRIFQAAARRLAAPEVDRSERPWIPAGDVVLAIRGPQGATSKSTNKPSVVIGSGPGDDLLVAGLPPRAARLEQRDGSVWIMPIAGRVQLDDRALPPNRREQLREGDCLRIQGTHDLVVTSGAKLEAESAEAGQPGHWKCSGGPHGAAVCGAVATHVGRDETGLEWFCCGEHTEGVGQAKRPDTQLQPIAEWLRLNELH